MERWRDDIEPWCAAELGAPVERVEAMAGGAGRRRYWRLWLENDRCVVLMHAVPEDPAILPPALRAPTSELPFLAVTRLLERQGLPVPRVYAASDDEAWLLLEDLGTRHLADLSGCERQTREREAVELLARVHAIPQQADALPFRRRFDRAWIGFELSLFLEELPVHERNELAGAFDELALAISELPACLCLRDYQSRNLMIDGAGRLRLIDYQDALVAPPELDLVALLWDSYGGPPPEQRTRLLARYAECAGRTPDPSSLALLIVQRKCKDFSRFRRLVRAGQEATYAPAQQSARAAALEALPELRSRWGGLVRALPRAFEALA